MSELEGIATYIFTWFSHADACKKCLALNGRDFHDQDLFQEVLWDPIWGDLWDLNADHSLAHGRQQYNCRCQLTVRVEFDWSKWQELTDFRSALKSWR